MPCRAWMVRTKLLASLRESKVPPSSHAVPRRATRKDRHLQVALLEVDPVEVGDLVLPPRGRRERGGYLTDALIVEVQAWHRVMGPGLRRLLLDR